jgi:hypothetical protein
MLSQLAMVGLGGVGEGVVGPIHERVLAEHGSHFGEVMIVIEFGLDAIALMLSFWDAVRDSVNAGGEKVQLVGWVMLGG